MSQSARPITFAERMYSQGQPLASFGALFGLSQGVLMHLQAQKLSIVSTNWFPNQQARLLGFVLIGGGALAGAVVGRKLFEEKSLQRLDRENQIDQAASAFNAQRK